MTRSTLSFIRSWPTVVLVALGAFTLIGCAANTYHSEITGYSKSGTPLVEPVVDGVTHPKWGLYRQVNSHDFQPRTDLPVAGTR